ncbi:nucleotide exchange factor GrpE [Streptomyces wuyuanensis]|uniref:Protein GrpE n=1 Tax=Streptomyces wuyuanensis TaxID=1196353 RepID=A0A1G9Q895_9ACTN|nr:nucleotide exchange factor GrpE [Streptomyces wuyuanensis]SDM06697.1 molecular chaperone GrpE [Streptomyces wuyuanensis]
MSTDKEPAPPQEPTGAPAPEAQPDMGELTAELDELRDNWRRSLADLDNLRKRHARELQSERSDERARTSAAWLPVVDNLELALQHAGSDPSAVLEGVRAVRDLAVEVLRGLGYPRYEDTGVPFDPAQHEVVGLVDDPGAEPNTVVRVQRPGYGEGDRQLRPAAVVVNKRQE